MFYVPGDNSDTAKVSKTGNTFEKIAKSKHPRPVEKTFCVNSAPPDSWAPIFKVDGVWYANATRYPSWESADASARARFCVWTQPTEYGVAASDEQPNRDEQGKASWDKS